MAFKFTQPKNLAVFTCTHVLNDKASILFASLGEDGYYQFLCGKDGHETSEGKIISLAAIVHLDDTLNQIANMEPGSKYTRKDAQSGFKKNDQ